MRRAIHITPKQLRVLTGLFIFLPLVPIAFFAWLVLRSDAIVDGEVPREMQRTHGDYLYRLAQAMPRSIEDPAKMIDYFEEAMPEGVGLRIIDRDRGVLAQGEAKFDTGNEVLSEALPSTFQKWKVQMSSIPGGFGYQNPVIGRELRGELKTAGLLLVLMLAAAAAAGLLLMRGMRLEALKSDTLTAISHELKTPVASMRLLLETLHERGVDDREQVAEYIVLMLQENERVSHMVEDFLNHTRLEEKQKRFKMERLNADEIAGEAVRRFAAKVEELGGRLRCYGRKTGMPLVHGDRQTLVMVLGILIDNAIQYSDEELDIEVDFFSDRRRVYFLVKDRGIGVAKLHRRRIFDKFYQANPKLSRRGGGCGLGLSIARHVISAHGGVIEHEPRRGAGSIFRFDVPVSVLRSELSTLASKPEPSPANN